MPNWWRKKFVLKNDKENKRAQGVSMAWNGNDKNTKANGNGRLINSIIKKMDF